VIPLKDYNPTRTTPLVTLVLMAACIGIYFLVQPTIPNDAVQRVDDAACANARFNLDNAAIPYELTEGRPLNEREAEVLLNAWGCPTSEAETDSSPGKSVLLAVVYSMFLHGGFLHLAGNMLYLWVFGNNVEDVMGRGRFLLFYLLCGLAAAAVHVWTAPMSCSVSQRAGWMNLGSLELTFTDTTAGSGTSRISSPSRISRVTRMCQSSGWNSTSMA